MRRRGNRQAAFSFAPFTRKDERRAIGRVARSARELKTALLDENRSDVKRASAELLRSIRYAQDNLGSDRPLRVARGIVADALESPASKSMSDVLFRLLNSGRASLINAVKGPEQATRRWGYAVRKLRSGRFKTIFVKNINGRWRSERGRYLAPGSAVFRDWEDALSFAKRKKNPRRRRNMSARVALKKLKKAGCREVRQKGSHRTMKCKSGQTVIPMHSGKDIPRGTLAAISRQTGVPLRANRAWRMTNLYRAFPEMARHPRHLLKSYAKPAALMKSLRVSRNEARLSVAYAAAVYLTGNEGEAGALLAAVGPDSVMRQVRDSLKSQRMAAK